MNEEPEIDENKRMILSVFKKYKLRAGECLPIRNFVSAAANNGWRNGDIADGLDAGIEVGWFRKGPNDSIELTEDGFAAIQF